MGTEQKPLRILVLGAGSVGAYYGGRLAIAGHELFFTARGAHLAALKRDGLKVKSVRGDFHLKDIVCEERFAPLGDLDLILVCVKHRDTKGILPVIQEQLCAKTVVINLQNGLDSEKALVETMPRAQVVGGIAFIGTRVEAPGRVIHTASGFLTVGELDGAATERVQGLKQTFKSANIPCGISKDLAKAKWEKLMWNVGFNALAVFTGLPANHLASYPPTAGTVKALMEELVAVAQKAGIAVDPEMPDKHIAHCAGMGETIPSMLQDVLAGRPTENEIINGAVCREGERLGVPTPLNTFADAAISAIDDALNE